MLNTASEMTAFRNTEKPLSAQDLENLEGVIGRSLPEQYKQHALMYNGGQCLRKKFSFVEKDRSTESDLDWMLAIYEGEHDNFIKYYNAYKVEELRIPEELFPIGHDSGGNLICMHFDSNEIFFWDHEIESKDFSEGIHRIAENLDNFFRDLH